MTAGRKEPRRIGVKPTRFLYERAARPFGFKRVELLQGRREKGAVGRKKGEVSSGPRREVGARRGIDLAPSPVAKGE